MLMALFDSLNMFLVVKVTRITVALSAGVVYCKSIKHCIQERGILGPLGQSFLKQGWF